MGIEDVVARRRAEQVELSQRARRFAADIPSELEVQAVVVLGSVARGDFNLWSDVDVMVIAERLPDRLLDRFEALGAPPARVQPIPWRPGEWSERLLAGDPMAVEATGRGVWIVGSPSVIGACRDPD